MSDEKNVELGVFEALNALAEEKNAYAETRETLRKNVRQSSESQAAPAERRRPGRPKKEKAPELPLDEAIATGLTNLRNAKAKHAPRAEGRRSRGVRGRGCFDPEQPVRGS